LVLVLFFFGYIFFDFGYIFFDFGYIFFGFVFLYFIFYISTNDEGGADQLQTPHLRIGEVKQAHANQASLEYHCYHIEG
jgi:hypothetical protein